MRERGMELSDTPGTLALDWIVLTIALLGTAAAVLATGPGGF